MGTQYPYLNSDAHEVCTSFFYGSTAVASQRRAVIPMLAVYLAICRVGDEPHKLFFQYRKRWCHTIIFVTSSLCVFWPDTADLMHRTVGLRVLCNLYTSSYINNIAVFRSYCGRCFKSTSLPGNHRPSFPRHTNGQRLREQKTPRIERGYVS